MATRLYYTATDVASLSPAFISGWADTTQAVRRNLSTSKIAATEVLSGTLAGTTGDNALIAQIVSLPLNGNQTITGTYEICSRGRELAGTDNINKRYRSLRVMSGDLATTRATIIAQSASASTTELTTSLAGQQHVTGGAVGTVNALDGDVIVLEIGYGESSTGTSPNWEMGLGGNGTDHANANGDTTGTVAWMEFSQNLTFQSAGVTGTLATTLDGSTLAASGVETIPGTLATTLDGATLAASGLVANPVTGTLATTLAGASLAGSGTETISGTLATTLAGTGLSATGTETFTGTLATTLAGATLAATGVSGDAVSGTLATTLAGATLAAAGVEQLSGTLATTLAGASLAAAGVVATPVTGTLTATLNGATLAATATETIPGTLTTTLAGATLASVGLVANPVTGTLTVTLDGAVLAASGSSVNPYEPAYSGVDGSTTSTGLDNTTSTSPGLDGSTTASSVMA